MRAPYRHNRFQFSLNSLIRSMTLFVVLLAMFGWIKAGPGGSGFPQLPILMGIHFSLLLSITVVPLASLVLAIVIAYRLFVFRPIPYSYILFFGLVVVLMIGQVDLDWRAISRFVISLGMACAGIFGELHSCESPLEQKITAWMAVAMTTCIYFFLSAWYVTHII